MLRGTQKSAYYVFLVSTLWTGSALPEIPAKMGPEPKIEACIDARAYQKRFLAPMNKGEKDSISGFSFINFCVEQLSRGRVGIKEPAAMTSANELADDPKSKNPFKLLGKISQALAESESCECTITTEDKANEQRKEKKFLAVTFGKNEEKPAGPQCIFVGPNTDECPNPMNGKLPPNAKILFTRTGFPQACLNAAMSGQLPVPQNRIAKTNMDQDEMFEEVFDDCKPSRMKAGAKSPYLAGKVCQYAFTTPDAWSVYLDRKGPRGKACSKSEKPDDPMAMPSFKTSYGTVMLCKNQDKAREIAKLFDGNPHDTIRNACSVPSFGAAFPAKFPEKEFLTALKEQKNDIGAIVKDPPARPVESTKPHADILTAAEEKPATVVAEKETNYSQISGMFPPNRPMSAHTPQAAQVVETPRPQVMQPAPQPQVVQQAPPPQVIQQAPPPQVVQQVAPQQAVQQSAPPCYVNQPCQGTVYYRRPVCRGRRCH